MMCAEEDLREPVRDWMLERGLDPHDEVQKCGKIPDVLGLRGSEIEVAVELKLSNWRRALYQATIYTTFAQESYIAMPWNKREVLERNLDEFIRWGVGILIVHDDSSVCEMHKSISHNQGGKSGSK
ncbi:MAG: hypothetical protein IH631_06485 [Candidatus Thorarchaeota archaeon]|nr:hypothetical protein [Candidatus Thorarchaeota archaeon]